MNSYTFQIKTSKYYPKLTGSSKYIYEHETIPLLPISPPMDTTPPSRDACRGIHVSYALWQEKCYASNAQIGNKEGIERNLSEDEDRKGKIVCSKKFLLILSLIKSIIVINILW